MLATVALVAWMFWPMARPAKYVFNVHVMFGHLVDTDKDGLEMSEVERFLERSPDSDDAREIALAKVENRDEADSMWHHQQADLMVTFRISDGKVKHLFLLPNTPSGAISDPEQLLELGNIKAADPDYKVDFVKTPNNPLTYKGVIVTPVAMLKLQQAAPFPTPTGGAAVGTGGAAVATEPTPTPTPAGAPVSNYTPHPIPTPIPAPTLNPTEQAIADKFGLKSPPAPR